MKNILGKNTMQLNCYRVDIGYGIVIKSCFKRIKWIENLFAKVYLKESTKLHLFISEISSYDSLEKFSLQEE